MSNPKHTARRFPNRISCTTAEIHPETIRCDDGKPFALDEHWKRLSHGADILKIRLPLNVQTLRQHISRLLSLNQLTCAGIRLTITRGVAGQRGLAFQTEVEPTVLISCFPISEKPAKPISITLSDMVINELSPLRSFKSLGYTENILARQKAIANGYDDALLCNTKGHLVSATSSNVFFVINDELHTPALTCGALPGVMRQHILSLARALQIPTHERAITLEDLHNANEAFLTNSLLRIQPIEKLAGRLLSSSITGKLASEAWPG